MLGTEIAEGDIVPATGVSLWTVRPTNISPGLAYAVWTIVIVVNAGKLEIELKFYPTTGSAVVISPATHRVTEVARTAVPSETTNDAAPGVISHLIEPET